MIVSHPLRAALALAFIFAAAPALAQVSDEQRSAIRAACRSDFMSNCSGVQPGGAAAFQCLQQNMAKLSTACKSAVSAVTPQDTSKETPKAAAAPKAETPKAEPQKAEAAPKTEPAPAKEPKPSAAPKTAATPSPSPAPKAAAAKPASAPAQTAAAPPTPPLILRPLRPLEEVRVLRMACGADAQTLCGAVQPGGGRIIQCLASQPDALSPACKEVLGQFAAQ